MDENDVHYLEKILTNETNENITNLNFQEIDDKKREIIDELEKQFDDKLCDLQGVRLVASNVYICLSKKE